MTEASRKNPTTWRKGQSGNPAGRKPGAELVRQLLEPKRAELVQKAVDMALAGDATALRICIDRLAPPARGEAAPVHIPALASAATLTDKATALLHAIGDGQVAPDTGAALLNALAAACRVAELDELARRLAALEAKTLENLA